MNDDIADLVQIMDETLLFTEQVDTLKDKPQPLLDRIEEVIRTVQECSAYIYEYLRGGVAGTYCFKKFYVVLSVFSGSSLNAFMDAKQPRNYKEQMRDLSGKLKDDILVHLLQKQQEHDNGISTFRVQSVVLTFF